MTLFTKHFGINKSQAQLDFVDIDTDKDKQLFIDPYTFAKSSDAWSQQCNEAILSFFEAVLEALHTGDDALGRRLLDNLHEPNETCLGLSGGRPSGRGVGEQQAEQLFQKIKESKAAKSGLLSELSDCELFIPNFSHDKISDVTTNIIRQNLIEYTQYQCDLHRIPLESSVPSGMLWNQGSKAWDNRYVSLPVIENSKILLVPKSSVRWSLAFSHQQYYNKFVLEFLQEENLRKDTGLVELLKNGRRRVTKESLKQIHPLSKNFLADFTESNPRVLETYKRLLSVSNGMTNQELDTTFDETIFAKSLIEELIKIDRGNGAATLFHDFMVGALEFIFYPNLIYPQKEDEIHEGRKRIDISYTNNSSAGFFFRRRAEAATSAAKVFVECKNYQKEIANPELDQLAGRFSPLRGRLGFLIGRSFDNRERFIARCRDTARDNRGFIIALVDSDMLSFLQMIADGKREMLDMELERRYSELLT